VSVQAGSIDSQSARSLEAKAKRCREMADVAKYLAANRDGARRKQYLDLADRWLALAAEMEQMAEAMRPQSDVGRHPDPA
jgi:hypothetical protein